jgi:4-azaleucine resistance transporter AzlC
MASANAELHQLDKSLIWSGFKQLAPISLFVTVFGAAFGLAAVQAGLDSTITVAMSTLVFAGAAQFAALDLWGPHIPLFTMMITVFAINARHLLMGATLYPWLSRLPATRRYGVMLLASDANWAMSMQAFSRGKPGLGLLFGGGLALWIFWVFGTWIGTYFGNAIRDPKGLGLDMVMGCFLLAMVVGGDKSMRMLFIWVVAGLSSLLAYWYLPENSHVVVGALAGGIAGTVIGDTKQ